VFEHVSEKRYAAQRLAFVLLAFALTLHAHAATAQAKGSDPKTDVDTLVRDLLPSAMESLEARRGLSPFGATMNANGGISRMPSDRPNGTLDSKQLLDRLLNVTLQSRVLQENMKATAAVFDARVAPPGQKAKVSAIGFYLDHCDNYSVDLYFPYEVNAQGKVSLGKAFSSWGARRIYFPRVKLSGATDKDTPTAPSAKRSSAKAVKKAAASKKSATEGKQRAASKKSSAKHSKSATKSKTVSAKRN
jgi:hypothetical protein